MDKKKPRFTGFSAAVYLAAAVIWTVLLVLRMAHLQESGGTLAVLTILTAVIWWAAALAQWLRWRREKAAAEREEDAHEV